LEEKACQNKENYEAQFLSKLILNNKIEKNKNKKITD
jgi:hypothetical protein